MLSLIHIYKDKNVILKVEFWNAYQVLRFRSFNNGYLNLEAIEDHLQRFLYHLLTAMNLNQYKSQGAQPGLAVKNLENLIAPVPALDVQERLVRVLDNFESICTCLLYTSWMKGYRDGRESSLPPITVTTERMLIRYRENPGL